MENIFWDIERALPVNIEVRSDIGGRDEQQDYVYIASLDHNLICTLCDGMGGSEYGALASKTAAEAVNSYLSHPQNSNVNLLEFPEILEKAFRYADQKVYVSSQGSGTTALTVVIQKNHIYWASIGDTRLYIFRKGELVQATRDHNYLLQLSQLYSEGYFSAKEYQAKISMGNALISYLGMGNASLFDLTEQPLRVYPKDTLLLATDGLYGVMPCEYMQKILGEQILPKEKADKLMGYVLNKSAEYVLDNTTFILIEI